MSLIEDKKQSVGNLMEYISIQNILIMNYMEMIIQMNLLKRMNMKFVMLLKELMKEQ